MGEVRCVKNTLYVSRLSGINNKISELRFISLYLIESIEESPNTAVTLL